MVKMAITKGDKIQNPTKVFTKITIMSQSWSMRLLIFTYLTRFYKLTKVWMI